MRAKFINEFGKGIDPLETMKLGKNVPFEPGELITRIQSENSQNYFGVKIELIESVTDTECFTEYIGDIKENKFILGTYNSNHANTNKDMRRLTNEERNILLTELNNNFVLKDHFNRIEKYYNFKIKI